MAEMIIPGTFIEVRAEGLIRPGPFSIGNIGIVGTARQGNSGDPATNVLPTVYTPANIGEAREIFGPSDAFDNPIEPGSELTLIRALELAFNNGARNVFAVRVADAAAVNAQFTLGPLTIDAIAPGTGYNDAIIATETGSSATELNVSITVGTIVETWRDVPENAPDFASVVNGNDSTYDYQNLSSTGGGSALFVIVENPVPAGDVPTDSEATIATPGTNGTANTDAADYTRGLDALLNQDVQIMVLAGQAASTAGMTAALVGNVENASTDSIKRDRIGIISDSANNMTAPAQDSGRLIFTGPGLKQVDSVSGREVTLSGGYTAAALAGRIASLNAHFSPTNKTINASGLEEEFNGTEIEQLLLGRACVLENRNGSLRIVRGITTSTNSAWKQITTRRIVDFAKFGVRQAADPFIGKLNNERVRQALKGSVNAMLADMVDREMLTAYTLEVTANRDQEIQGIVVVTMTLQPTFSIDFIRVVMFLQ